jgi:hypothetical protein
VKVRYPTSVPCSCGQRARRWTRDVPDREALRFLCTERAHDDRPIFLDVHGRLRMHIVGGEVEEVAVAR